MLLQLYTQCSKYNTFYNMKIQGFQKYYTANPFLILKTGFSDFLTENTTSLLSFSILLKFEAEGQEFAKFLRSLELFIQTLKDQSSFW